MAMNPGMRMMLADRVRQPENNSRSEYGGGNRRMIGYDRDMDGNATTSGYGGMETENRRRRDSRGRYMMARMDDEPEMRSQSWYPPNMHGGSGYSFGDVYADIHAPNAMNRPMHGGMEHEWAKPVDEHTARMWVSEMDGGEKWKPEQIEQLRQTMCPECAKWEFYVAINAMYSDYCETAKKMGMDKPDFYASLARDFLMDKDAGPHKLRKYMETIPKH